MKNKIKMEVSGSLLVEPHNRLVDCNGIYKFASVITVVGQITGGNGSLHRGEIEHMTEWYRNYKLNVSKTQKVIDFRKGKSGDHATAFIGGLAV